MTPEDRARGIAEDGVFLPFVLPDEELKRVVETIANAIREAEERIRRETIESCAQLAERCTVVKPNWGTRKAIAARLRSLSQEGGE